MKQTTVFLKEARKSLKLLCNFNQVRLLRRKITEGSVRDNGTDVLVQMGNKFY